MTTPIYHITHLRNLASIIAHSCVWSDHQRTRLGFISQNIGYSHIKARRMNHSVSVAQGQTLGCYVPFNFCPRSVMLFVVSKGHGDYQDGQAEILHLVSNVETIVAHGRPYFFTDIHADLAYAQQLTDVSKLNTLNWDAIDAYYWSDPEVKAAKQAEFLAYDFVAWTNIKLIVVKTQQVAEQVQNLIINEMHKPIVEVKPSWYY
jgi:agmatine/peptidylarginine deiminase